MLRRILDVAATRVRDAERSAAALYRSSKPGLAVELFFFDPEKAAPEDIGDLHGKLVRHVAHSLSAPVDLSEAVAALEALVEVADYIEAFGALMFFVEDNAVDP